MKVTFGRRAIGRVFFGAAGVVSLSLLVPPAAHGVVAVSADAQRWWSHVLFLAGDGLEGRETGSPGYRKAARYVETRMRNAGLEPAGTAGDPPPIPLGARRVLETETTA